MAAMFDPWMLGQQFGGILGGHISPGYDQKDIEALIKGYGPQWGNLPQADAPQEGVPSSTPMGSAPPNPYGNPAGLMPTFGATVSTEGAPQPPAPQNPYINRSWLVPGGFLDKFAASAGQSPGGANAAPITPGPAPLSSGAEPNAVWGPSSAPQPPQMNVPMPQPRPPGLGQQPAAQSAGPPLNILPQNANAPPPVQMQPAPQMPPQTAMAQDAGPDFGSRMLAGANNFSDPHAGLIARFANSIQGFQTGQNTNPAMQPKIMETGTDPNTGQKTFATFDARTGRMTPVSGGQGAGNPGQNNGFLAPGVQYVNSGATGEDYLKQWSPEVQSTAKAMLAGHIVPTGNPRQNQLASKAKEVAVKYASDMGIPFGDERYSEMKKFRTELGSTAPGTVGGQAKAFGQGIEHMHALAKTDLAMDNSGGWGIPKLAEWANGLRQATSTEQSALAVKAQGLGQTLAGEVGKLFSGSAGGGVEERRQTRERFDTVKSPKELAAALEGTLETMYGGLAALEKHRARVFAGHPPSDTELVDADTKENIKKVEGIIAQLRGEKQPAGSGAQSGLKPGTYNWTPNGGAK